MSADKNSEIILSLFSIGGKTMIGKIITYPKKSTVGSGANYDTTDGNGFFMDTLELNSEGTDINYDKYYFIKNPAEIVYDLKIQEGETGKLTWSVIPFLFGALKTDPSKDVVVAYEKSQVSISDALATTIHSDLISAYNEIV